MGSENGSTRVELSRFACPVQMAWRLGCSAVHKLCRQTQELPAFGEFVRNDRCKSYFGGDLNPKARFKLQPPLNYWLCIVHASGQRQRMA